MTLVTMSARARATVLADATRRAPSEACGLLVGEGQHVAQAYPLPNRSDSADRFIIDPADHHQVLMAADADDQEIIGVYHSHPRGAAYPSEIDLRSPLDSRWVNVVVAPVRGGWEIRAFAIVQGRASELSLRREAPAAGLR